MSRNRTSLGVIVLLSGLAVAMSSTGALAAQGRGQGRGQAKKAEKAEHKQDKKDPKTPAVVIDRDGHVRIIREYAHGGSLPPGLAKRESLPPGLRKQLRERGELPPGLQKRLVPVPAMLVTRLPAVPSYYQRYFAGDDFIVVDTRTHRIAIIILDVWR